MRCLSKIFQPFITVPKNAKIKNTEITCKSQKLLLECGLVRPTSSGLFALLPLARRSLFKLETLIRTSLEDVGAQPISLPALSSASLWEASSRLQSAPAELLKVDDRHGKKYLLAPTHEEGIADLLADVGPLSYKQLPIILYQISNKYRDEHRPKHGLLRAREFLMMDAYGVHASEKCAETSYKTLTEAYSGIFETLNLKVGHTFILGTKYSDALGATYIPASDGPRPVIMSCYGIGITRLLAAGVEGLSSETALRWPEGIAPFHTLIIGPKEGSNEFASCERHIRDVYNTLTATGRDAVVDDRQHLTIGKRLLMADRMGYPNVIVVGRAALGSTPKYELHRTGLGRESNPTLLTLDELREFQEETIKKRQVA